MKNKNFEKWFKFVVLVLGGGTIYKLASLKDAFYIPMQEFFGLTHTQIGNAMSIWGIVASFGFIFSIYLSDRFSKRTLIPASLIATGCLGFYLATFPSYQGILITWALFGVVCDMAYWPVLLKAVRLLGNKDEQGRMFGFLEAGRGVVDTIVAFSALGIFALLGKGAAGFRGAILFYSGTVIVVGIISYFLIEDDKIKTTDDGKKFSRNKLAIDGVIRALKMPEIWMVAFNIFCVYSVYCGLTYFIPFLKDIYGLPVTLVGAYGVINVYGLKMVGGPIGGFLADKKFKSASTYLKIAFAIFAVAMITFIMLPHESMNVYVGMILTLGIGAVVFTQRAVFFAPMEEVGVPREISGAAMSIGSFIGYAPAMFLYSVYGGLLDKTPGMGGYKQVFMIMTVFAVIGFVINSILCKMIKKKKATNQELSA